MEMLNRATDGAALFNDMMRKVEAGAATAQPTCVQVAAVSTGFRPNVGTNRHCPATE